MEDWSVLRNGSDIRGIALEGVVGQSVNLTDPVVRTLGFSFGQWLAERNNRSAAGLRVAVGHDSRLSAERIKNAVFQGMARAGCTLFDTGLSSTPAMFMSTVLAQHGYDGAIMLTASHLPFNRNGMKFFTRDGGVDAADVKRLLAIASHTGEMPESIPCRPKSVNLMDEYAAHLVRVIRNGTGAQEPLLGLQIVVDAGNGAGGFFVDKVLRPLGANTEGSQFLDPDGRFPNHIPNPEDQAAMAAIVDAVERHRADLGIIFDTDVDRAGAVDKNAQPINRNRFIALMACIVLDEHPGTTIVTDSVTSTGLKHWIEDRLGGVHHRFQRGYRNVIRESMRLNAEGKESWLALETSGHGALKENFFLDDGAYQIAKILIKMARMKAAGEGTIDELIAALPEPAEAAEYRLKVKATDFGACADGVLSAFKTFVENEPGWALTPNNYEGVHVTCGPGHGNGWALLRKSLHDPVMPLNVESEEPGGVAKITQRLKAFFTAFDQLELPAM